MKQLAPISQKQYEKFVKDMADYHAPSSLNEPMTKDMLPLFRQKAKPNKSSAKNKLGSLKDGWRLSLILFISCQSKKGDLPAVFLHENQNCPPSLSQKGMLHSAVKSQLYVLLGQVTNTTYEQPNVCKGHDKIDAHSGLWLWTLCNGWHNPDQFMI